MKPPGAQPPPTRYGPAPAAQRNVGPVAFPAVVPPPTRYGPALAAQRNAGPVAFRAVAPPPTRYGPALAAQRNAGPVAFPAVVPPPTRYGPALAAQRNAGPVAFRAVAPPPPRYGTAAPVQQKPVRPSAPLVQRGPRGRVLQRMEREFQLKSLSAKQGGTGAVPGKKMRLDFLSTQRSLVQRGGSNQVIQRLIIRIRDVKEIVGWSEPTIMKASKALKNDLPRNDPQSQEDVGVTEATGKGHRKLNANEPLIIVAHGSAPSVGNLISNGIPTLGNYQPGDLVAKIEPLFPAGYHGSIYLDGCYTGRRLNYGDGTSYIERFARALKATRPDIDFTVKGNIGAAATSSDGVEYVTLTRAEANLGKTKGWTIYEVKKDGAIEYKVASPFGMAYCSAAGVYNDYGLSKLARRQAQNEAQRAERDRMVNLRISLSPKVTEAQQDQIWNEIL